MSDTFGLCFTLGTNPGARGYVENNCFIYFENSVYPESQFRISLRAGSAFTDIKLFYTPSSICLVVKSLPMFL